MVSANSFRYGILGELEVPLAFGLLRLATEGRPAREDAVALIHHVLDRGIRVLDTGDSYCLSKKDFHFGEELAREAVASWDGPKNEVKVLTKVGLTRPKGRWVPDGSPKHLRATVDGSLKAFNCEQLYCVLSHVNDPRVPYEESLGALAGMQAEGKILHLGLCNVSVAEIRQAQRLFNVTVIQNELSVIDRKGATSGVLELARQEGIPFLAHRPLGGHAKTAKLLKNRAVKPIAEGHGVTPHEAAIAALLDHGPPLIPLFGATKVENVDSTLSAVSIQLNAEDRKHLSSKVSFKPDELARLAIEPEKELGDLRELKAGQGPGKEPEVVIIMGIQGAGKTDLVEKYTKAGFERLNRDLLGGKLDDLIPRMLKSIKDGHKRIVLDNTYSTKASRFLVVRAAHRHGIPVRCIYLMTTIRDAHINVVNRILDKYDKLLGPDEMKEFMKEDPTLPPPSAMNRWVSTFEAPDLSEGFSVVEEIPFVRRPLPKRTKKGLLLDVDGTIRKTKSGELYPREPDDIEILPNRKTVLQKWIDKGYELFFVSNQSGIASGKLTAEKAEECFERTIELLGLPVAGFVYCPHSAFPVGCFCRKPLPGLAVFLARKYELDPTAFVMVGDLKSDREFAEAIGAEYYEAGDFFGGD